MQEEQQPGLRRLSADWGLERDSLVNGKGPSGGRCVKNVDTHVIPLSNHESGKYVHKNVHGHTTYNAQ